MAIADVLEKFFTIGPDDDYEDDEYDEEEEAVSRRRSFRAVENDDDDEEDKRSSSRSKVTKMPRTRRSALSQAGMEVCVIKPTTAEDSKVIVDTLLENRTVVVNLDGIDLDVAQRIMDYTSGANAALDGHLQKISKNIFIVTPRTVEIFGDYQELTNGNFEL
ncbi:MAG: cell division protein SepF [Lachnospiraceae bacterium]|nr:cell division protein SepF [Lachnospiraceae bacterium]